MQVVWISVAAFRDTAPFARIVPVLPTLTSVSDTSTITARGTKAADRAELLASCRKVLIASADTLPAALIMPSTKMWLLPTLTPRGLRAPTTRSAWFWVLVAERITEPLAFTFALGWMRISVPVITSARPRATSTSRPTFSVIASITGVRLESESAAVMVMFLPNR